MRLFNKKVFDDVISGTTTDWFSRAEFNAVISQADSFAVQAVTTGVGGIFPGLTVTSEHSSDGINWIATGNSELGYFIAATPSNWGQYFPLGNGFTNPPLAAFVRLRIHLNGLDQSTQCRLKLYVTGRTFPL